MLESLATTPNTQNTGSKYDSIQKVYKLFFIINEYISKSFNSIEYSFTQYNFNLKNFRHF